MESLQHFEDRIYTVFDWYVWVYPEKRGKGKPEKWTIQQSKEYWAYLEQREKNERAPK